MLSIITPIQLEAQLPVSSEMRTFIDRMRQAFVAILNGKDDRLVVIVGPCSLHHPQSALIYAKKLQPLIEKHDKNLMIIMRAYIEKARTNIGWKGFVNDPDLNNSFQIEKGLFKSRELLLSINQLGVPTASEILNPFTWAYFSDIPTWAAIGARTTESQVHRELASHFSLPIGFKNNTQGDIQAAIDGVQTAKQTHHFLGLDNSGKIAMIQTNGNPHCHVVLRGSHHQSNFDIASINKAMTALSQLHLSQCIMVDCSHGNSSKNHTKQIAVANEIAHRIENGDRSCFGIMLESHLVAGKQMWNPSHSHSSELSITDACIGWHETEIALETVSQAVQKRRNIHERNLVCSPT